MVDSADGNVGSGALEGIGGIEDEHPPSPAEAGFGAASEEDGKKENDGGTKRNNPKQSKSECEMRSAE